ncbi:hypothetical protein HNQ60_000243 [Povalibacter uvarum]|uniref:Uncharacterized protein n=1 Tax=Povalibacter uvarum TaxID=732238 RepID=A0A841HEV0_9GAMM|nr:hypothetical protein [Povalibacter uvarum]MBB6091397.1 hypothetical protein [Povalibacter uvarum]
MDLSETIIAAMIGALATVGTALFQLLTAFKQKGRIDIKPKRGLTARSIFSVIALMIASAGGGFLYSQFLQQRAGEDIRAMRQELRELRDLTASRVLDGRPLNQSVQQLADVAHSEPPKVESAQPAVPVSLEPEAGVAESIAYVPACRAGDATTSEGAGVQCEEADAQRIALCGTVPAHANVAGVQLFAQPDAVQHPWDQHVAALEADIGGARFTGRTFEYAQGQNAKAVCVNFMQWSSQHPHIARIVVQYSFDEDPVPPAPMPVVSHPVMTQASGSDGGIQAASPGAPFGGPATALR